MKLILVSLIFSKAILLYLVISYCWTSDEPCEGLIEDFLGAEPKVLDSEGPEDTSSFVISLSQAGEFFIGTEKISLSQIKAVLKEASLANSEIILEVEAEEDCEIDHLQGALAIATESNIAKVVFKKVDAEVKEEEGKEATSIN